MNRLCSFEGYEYVDALPPPAARTNATGVWQCEEKDLPIRPLRTVRLKTIEPARSLCVVSGSHGVVCVARRSASDDDMHPHDRDHADSVIGDGHWHYI